MDLIGVDKLNKETIPMLQNVLNKFAADVNLLLSRFIDGITITIHIKKEVPNEKLASDPFTSPCHESAGPGSDPILQP